MRAPSTPAGSGTPTGPLTSVTRAPKFRERRGDRMSLPPAGTIGDVAHRIDRLVRRSAGDQRMSPASGRAGASSASIAARIAGGSASRPGPNSLQAIAPSSGPTTWMPRDASSAMFACVAACSHMRTFIAGATSTGLSVASSSVERQIVRQPGRHLRQDVGRGRRDHDKIGAARKLDVPHLALVGQREQVGVDLAFAQRLQRQRRDELRAGLRSARRSPRSRARAAAGSARAPCTRRCRPKRSAARACRRGCSPQPSSPSPFGRGLGGGGASLHVPSQPPPRMNRRDPARQIAHRDPREPRVRIISASAS